MNISSTSSRLTGLTPGTLRENDAPSTQKSGAAPEGPANSGALSARSADLESVAASGGPDGLESAFSASDAQAALQGALQALIARPDAAIAAQAPSSPASILGLLEVA